MTWYRWVILASFCLMMMSHIVISIGFTTFTSQLQLAYGLSSTFWPVAMVDLNNILFLPMNFISAKVFKMFRIHHTLIAVTIFQGVFCWIRLFSVVNWNFSWMMIG